MQWVASTLHTTSEHGVSSITTADTHTSAAGSRLKLTPPPADLNGLVRFAERPKSGFCTCAVIFQLDCIVVSPPSESFCRHARLCYSSITDAVYLSD
jgi:hypothetical protein